MLGAAFCVATAVLGIDVGWEPDPQGNVQYVLQIEPELAQRMLEGKTVEFDLRPEHLNTRHVLVRVGKGKPPRIENPAASQTNPKEVSPAKQGQASSVGPKIDREWSAPPSVDTPKTSVPATKAAPREPLKTTSPETTAPSASNHPPELSATSPLTFRPDATDAPSLDERQVGFGGPAVRDGTGSTGETTNTSLFVAWCTSAGLAAAFLYLCWIHLGTRRRYRALLSDYHAAVGGLSGFAPTTPA
ncbi:MAG TPA: hypothetical protein VJL29_02980 [Thermoguttaceae bacterium]|nr:hypothetical protein [Thermoguttaceae bacterium]